MFFGLKIHTHIASMRTLTLFLVMGTAPLTYSISGIDLSSNPETVSVCLGEKVVYTCKVERTGVLQWAVESYHRIAGDPILFVIGYHSVGSVVTGGGGLFNATLTDISPVRVYWGNMTSTLTVLASYPLDNKRISCSNGEEPEETSPYKLLTIARLPSAPQNLTYSTIENSNDEKFMILFHWEEPANTGGVNLSNYTARLNEPNQEIVTTGQEPSRQYLIPHSRICRFEVAASNCMGAGSPARLLDIHLMRFNVGNNTEIYSGGSGEALATMEDQSANCPLSHINNCPLPEDTMTLFAMSGTVAIRGTVPGSLVDYNCGKEKMVSVCTIQGEWSPAIQCHEEIDCVHPTSPDNSVIYVTGTHENSQAIILCNAGWVLKGEAVSTCREEGWLPNPVLQQCIESPTEKTQEPNSYAINNQPSYIVTLGVSMILQALLHPALKF